MRRALAPLEPDLFMRWAWLTGPRTQGTSPCTIEDLHFELGGVVTLDELRRDWVRLAARVRRNQRLGLGPWEGIR